MRQSLHPPEKAEGKGQNYESLLNESGVDTIR